MSTESCATAVDLMQLDQDARQVCKERKLTRFQDCTQVSTVRRMTTLCLKVPSCPSIFPSLFCGDIS